MTAVSTKERQYVIQGKKDLEAVRIDNAVTHMRDNKAYRYAVEDAGGDPDGAILRRFIERYRWYRASWRGLPSQAVELRAWGDRFRDMKYPPLCVDIESAAICDLACSFCFRQWVATPDKIINLDFYKRIVDQCAEIGVPSLKLNWRGEPLLHPKLPEMIDYAKRKGILEVIINTNATTLTEAKSRELIEAGLDMMIYSFDGGTKATYEMMRPGRFGENTFEAVYGSIRRFAEIRKEMGSVFPRTRVQMVLTDTTFGEQKSFFELFENCVDDVSVKAYTERGGKVGTLDADTKDRILSENPGLDLSEATPIWRDIHGNVFVSLGRIPCEQPFQRMMVTYDGRVSMCCYDWGSQYPVGYLSSEAYVKGEAEYAKIMKRIERGDRGFDQMAGAQLPAVLNRPEPVISSIADVWYGSDITTVRKKHVCGEGEEVSACKHCTFKETYNWLKVHQGARAS